MANNDSLGWLNPINKIRLRDAFLNQRPTVSFQVPADSGLRHKYPEIELALTYTPTQIKFRPTEQGLFTPCGAFSKKRVLDVLWLAD